MRILAISGSLRADSWNTTLLRAAAELLPSQTELVLHEGLKAVPPFDEDSARQKVKAAQDAWNTRDPEKVSLAYTEDSKWRNRDEFFEGREAIRDFLRRKWQRELDYRLQKNLWCFTEDRIAVRFEYESRDAEGRWWRSHGNELWEFDQSGLMKRRDASINDYEIDESERRIF